jgi:RNase P/RNase MRP subunit p30
MHEAFDANVISTSPLMLAKLVELGWAGAVVSAQCASVVPPAELRLHTRHDVVVSEPADLAGLKALSAKADIVAVSLSSSNHVARLMELLDASGDAQFDLFSIDLAGFVPNRLLLHKLLRANVCIEICYASLLCADRQRVLAVARALVPLISRHSKGGACPVVLSGKVADAFQLRSPAEVAAIARLLGFREKDALRVSAGSVKDLLLAAAKRRRHASRASGAS